MRRSGIVSHYRSWKSFAKLAARNREGEHLLAAPAIAQR
jgi:hypothetical protein